MATSVGEFLVSGEKTVTTAGTAEKIEGTGTGVTDERRVTGLLIIAKVGNAGQVYVGGADVASGTNDGLAPGEFVSLKGSINTGNIFVDVDTDTEGVDWYATLN